MSIIFAAAGVLLPVLAFVVAVGYFVMRKAYLQELAKHEARIIDEGTVPTLRGGTSSTDVASDLNSQLSAKTIVLEKLIADSQKQIDRMEELLSEIERAKRN
jgi:hypothetical protein